MVYSHRSIWLQALGLCSANSVALSDQDIALLAVPRLTPGLPILLGGATAVLITFGWQERG